jgi:GNAT superfamily N-acetyltransferase
MQFCLRLGAIDDAVGIASVQVTTWRNAYKDIIDSGFLTNFSIERATEIQRGRIGSDGAHRIVATVNGQIVGYAVCNLNETGTEPFRGDWFLFALYVLPDFQGMGIGKALLSGVIQEGKARGFVRLVFGVFSANDPSKAFYKRNGAVFIEELPFQLDGKSYPTDYCEIVIES